jgi:hypothetical protein
MFFSASGAPCASCGAVVSPQWRCAGTLCNACGIKLVRGRLKATDSSATLPAKGNQAAVNLPPAAASAPKRTIAAQYIVDQAASDLDTGNIARHRSTRKRSLPKWYQEYESGEEMAEEEASEDSECTEVG